MEGTLSLRLLHKYSHIYKAKSGKWKDFRHSDLSGRQRDAKIRVIYSTGATSAF
jgi:hypothetical protein